MWLNCLNHSFILYFAHGLDHSVKKKPLKHNGTVSPRSSDPFYIVTYYIKWVTTSWTYSIFTWLEYYILGVCNDFAQPPTSGLNSGHRGQVQTDEDEENDLLGQIDQAHTMTARLPGRPVSGARLDLNRDINCALWSFPPPPFLDSFFPRQINLRRAGRTAGWVVRTPAKFFKFIAQEDAF